MEPDSSSISSKLGDKALPMYKLTYAARGCPKKFEKVWTGWIKYVSGDVEVWWLTDRCSKTKMAMNKWQVRLRIN